MEKIAAKKLKKLDIFEKDFVLWCDFLEKWQESLIFFEKKRIEQKVMEGFNNLFKNQKIDKNKEEVREILISSSNQKKIDKKEVNQN